VAAAQAFILSEWCRGVTIVQQTDGRTPLFAASRHGYVGVVRVLAGAGAAVNQAEVRGYRFGTRSVRVVAGWDVWVRGSGNESSHLPLDVWVPGVTCVLLWLDRLKVVPHCSPPAGMATLRW
jgi:hypothetical protein